MILPYSSLNLNLSNALWKSLNVIQNVLDLSSMLRKTQANYIGSQSSSDYYHHGLSWIRMHIVTLGIVITDGDDNNYKYNFQPKIAMLKTTLNI